MSSKNSSVVMKKEKFSGFNVSLKTGSKNKKRLSNHLKIEVDTPKASAVQTLTIREARALKRFLDENLDSTSA